MPGASDIAPTGDEVKAAFDVAPEDLQASTVSPGSTDFNIVFRAGPSSLEDRAPIVKEIRDDTNPPEGITLTPSGLAVVGVGLLENLEANRVELTYLALLFVFLFLAVRLRSVVRALLSLVPVAIAVGLASIVAWAFDLQAQPDDRGRRAARDRGVHRVHVADPVALRRGARPRLRPAAGHGRDRGAHRSGVHRLRAHRDRRRRGAVVLVAAAAGATSAGSSR